MSTAIHKEIFLQRIRVAVTNTTILQYDSSIDGLCLWEWPVDAEARLIVPSDLRDHRRSHKFLGPCCLCPLTVGQPTFVEAALYMATSGQVAGEYVAECALGRCGYFKRLYNKRCLPVRTYQARDESEPHPPAVLHLSEYTISTSRATRRPLKRAYALLDINSNVPIPEAQAPAQSRPEAIDQLLQLDASRRPGLTYFDFQALFTACRCGTIMTTEVFHLHYCWERGRGRFDTEEETRLAEVTQAAAGPFERLMLLNCRNRPGLTEARFVVLFARCTCGIITTRKAFGSHYCQRVDLIDLTKD